MTRVAAVAVILSCTRASLTSGVAQLTVTLTVSEVCLRAESKLSVLNTLPIDQHEFVFTGITVVISWPSTGATVAVTGLTVSALVIHKETFLAVIHTLAIVNVESLFTPVALELVTDFTLFVFTWITHHGVVHIVGPIWTGLMTV